MSDVSSFVIVLLYFVVLIVFGTFFLLNYFLAECCMAFNRQIENRPAKSSPLTASDMSRALSRGGLPASRSWDTHAFAEYQESVVCSCSLELGVKHAPAASRRLSLADEEAAAGSNGGDDEGCATRGRAGGRWLVSGIVASPSCMVVRVRARHLVRDGGVLSRLINAAIWINAVRLGGGGGRVIPTWSCVQCPHSITGMLLMSVHSRVFITVVANVTTTLTRSR